MLSIRVQQTWRINKLWWAKQGPICGLHCFVLHIILCGLILHGAMMKFLAERIHEKPITSSKYNSLSASFCCAWVTGPANIGHNFCFDFCCFFQLKWRDTLICVLSACVLLTFCAVFAWERPNSNLQKQTVVNCQGWSLSCYPPLCIKKLCFSLWCAGTSVLLGMMPPAFLAFIRCQSSWHQSRVCINECSPVCMKWFCHSRRTLSTPNIRLQNRGRMLMWVFWRYAYMVTSESPDVFFMACTVLGWLVLMCIQLDLLFLDFLLIHSMHLFLTLTPGIRLLTNN